MPDSSFPFPPKLDIDVGAKSHFFQSPKTPSTSSSLRTSIHSLPSQHPQHVNLATSRKRSRCDSLSPYQATPFQTLSHPSPNHLSYHPSSALESSLPLSPVPFVNEQYRLAGGLDTPTARLTMTEEWRECRPLSDLHLRGGCVRDFQQASDSYFPQSTSALSRESNGRPRQHTSPPIQSGLGKAVYGMVSVAGRVWDFCRTTAFRGFYAGGGQGYSYSQSIQQEAEHNDVLPSNLYDKTLVLGCFPEEDFIPDYIGSQNQATPPRAAKKIQREKGMGGDTSASWVLVSHEMSPSRLSSRKTPRPNTSSRRSRPKLGRKPILPASRPSLTSFAGSPGLHIDRCASFASPRSPVTSPKRESPLNAEVQRQAARMRKRDQEEEANLKRLNQQLKALIKEGKEALGTKFEVLEPVDEGCVGGEYVYGSEE